MHTFLSSSASLAPIASANKYQRNTVSIQTSNSETLVAFCYNEKYNNIAPLDKLE
jgi:hypothetical protein